MIREAIVEDIPSIIEMAHGFYTDAIEQHGLGYVAEDYSKYIVFLIESNFTVVFVSEENNKITGTIAGIISPWFMNNKDIILTEQWVWVEPEARGKGLFSELINSLVTWGKNLGATKLSMISIGSKTEKQVKKFYSNKGFQYMETHFIKDI